MFNKFTILNQNVKVSSLNIRSSWRVAWGKVDLIREEVTWRDKKLAIITPERKAIAISPSQRFVIIGDLWLGNKVELLQKLGLEPSKFLGNDSEIIARAWEKWGLECLSLLKGMFALAVWDRDKQILYCVRDCSGARTLYYTTNNNNNICWIAPKLRTLTPYRSQEPDLVALRDYLATAFVPGERTLWRDIKEVRPGTVIQFPQGKITSYWKLQENIQAADKPLAWHGQKLRYVLNRVVREYLPPQQPVGVFLSGGLDSSCITALVAKFHDAPVHTYSIHFGSESPNELEFSSLVANHCQTQHHILEITFKDMWECLPETMAYLDNPIGDPLTVPNLLLGRLLMALNIKFKGADHILTKVNNLTQAEGLLGLSPLFDQRIVQLSMTIPPIYKLSVTQEKAVLKQAVADILPQVIIDRPKSGMMVPVQRGFRHYWQQEARNLLLNRRGEISPYLNRNVIRKWLNYQGDTWGRYGIKLWLLTSLEVWLQENK
ncbi:MAG: asparagine synthase-related protein [Xenococcaceae cyanobacterium MO_188.B32]|nr:asparagine synthase-related protein [Xenococcaceae cyanobacterium MO_188.B32]